LRIAIGSDHAGFEYKQRIIESLRQERHEVKDFGTNSTAPVDYPLFIFPVARAVASNEFERGIVLGGSGNGEAMVANRVIGVRCAFCNTPELARLAREHNDANMISLGQRIMTLDTALACIKIFLETPFAGGRHQERIALIDCL